MSVRLESRDLAACEGSDTCPGLEDRRCASDRDSEGEQGALGKQRLCHHGENSKCRPGTSGPCVPACLIVVEVALTGHCSIRPVHSDSQGMLSRVTMSTTDRDDAWYIGRPIQFCCARIAICDVDLLDYDGNQRPCPAWNDRMRSGNIP